jgi:phytoene synthase
MDEIAAFARRHDPDRFLCALFAPPARRGALFALTGFNHELARVREAASQPVAALIRLQWWREAVEEAASGRPARRHEVAAPLHAAVASGALDPRDLLAMIDAREAETAEDGISSRGAFDAYLRGTAGGFAVAAGRSLGADGAALATLQARGAAYGLAGVLRSVDRHAVTGRCLLPVDLLTEAGLTPAEVVAAPRRADALVRRLAEEGGASLHAARHGLVPRAAVAAALPAVLAARDLRRLARGEEVPSPRRLGDRFAVVTAGLRGRA